MKKWTIPLAALAAVPLAAGAHATLGGDGCDLHARFGRMLHGGTGSRIAAHLDDVSARLELDLEQRRRIAALILAALPELEARARELEVAHERQLGLVRSPTLDEAAIREAAARLGEAEGEIAVRTARLLRDVHAGLSPEQLARATELHRPDLRGLVREHLRGLGQGVREWAGRQ